MTETSISEFSEDAEEDNLSYLEAVGSLLSLSQISRSDIAYAVNVVSSFSKEPKKIYCQAVK